MRMGGLAKGFVSIVIAALFLFVLTFVHPGTFLVTFTIPDPRTLMEIVLGIAFIVAIILISKCKIRKSTKIALISVLLSIALYFILRFIHIPGKVLWGFLVLSLVTIVWVAVSVIVDKKK